MKFRIETEREVDGRWIAEIPSLPGVMAYGATKREAVAKARFMFRAAVRRKSWKILPSA